MTFIAQLDSTVHNAATKLLALAAGAQSSIHSIEASSPLVKAALDMAVSEAAANGVPIPMIEQLGSDVLSIAQTVASETASAAGNPTP